VGESKRNKNQISDMFSQQASPQQFSFLVFQGAHALSSSELPMGLILEIPITYRKIR
jgi:hypothetical protein